MKATSETDSVTFDGGCVPEAQPSFKRTPFFLRNQGCSAEQIRLANKINETSSFCWSKGMDRQKVPGAQHNCFLQSGVSE